MPVHHLISTVGTSLLFNLGRLDPEDPKLASLRAAWEGGQDAAIGRALAELPPDDRVCGAEINSIHSLFGRGLVHPDAHLHFMCSATDDGRRMGRLLEAYYRGRGPQPAVVEVVGLQDQAPQVFRTEGLRNLAREISKVIRSFGPEGCAIDATGGYKAQIAIGVVLGQALGVHVHYKHERFDEVIDFPPLPVALDLRVWMRASPMLEALAEDHRPEREFAELWEERFESLVDRVVVEGETYLDLSPTGQIFHETQRQQFESQRDRLLPDAVEPARKQPPSLETAGWPGENPEIERLMRRVTEEVPFVVRCRTFYFNPDLPKKSQFKLEAVGGTKEIVRIESDGTYCVKFVVETSARTEREKEAAVPALNGWAADPHYFDSDEARQDRSAAKERDEYAELFEEAEAERERLEVELERTQQALAERTAAAEKAEAALAEAETAAAERRRENERATPPARSPALDAAQAELARRAARIQELEAALAKATRPLWFRAVEGVFRRFGARG